MDFSELLSKRTCVRSYTDKSVTKEELCALLEAGVRAPNACNDQSWHFYAVCDKALIDAFHPAIARIPWIEAISLLIVVCLKDKVVERFAERFGEQGREFAQHDAAGAANHILLKAADLGLGGCWIGPMEKEKCKAHLSMAEGHTPVAILTIGTPSADMPLRQRKPLDEVVTVIGTLPDCHTSGAEGEKENPFSLAHASLPNAVFEDLNLAQARFENINLHNASFADINMSHTHYGGLTMSEAHFGCVELCGAEFDHCDLRVAEFRNTSFENATLSDCKIDGMKIDGMDIKALLEQNKA